MKSATALLLSGLMVFAPGDRVLAQVGDDPLTRPIEADPARGWTTQQPPARIFGNTYLVGFTGLNVGLIRTSAGLILIDGGLPQGTASVEAHLAALGFSIRDVKFILSTEPHFDHAGAIAALARDSGATVLAGAAAVAGLRAGAMTPDDPQAGYDNHWPAVARVRAVRNGQRITLGSTVITAVSTPGHTMGSTSWTWQSCELKRCLPVVFASSLNPTTHEKWRYTTRAGARYVTALRSSIARFKAMPCGILLTSHPEQSEGAEKYKGLLAHPAENPFIAPEACKKYAARFEQALDARLSRERERPADVAR